MKAHELLAQPGAWTQHTRARNSKGKMVRTFDEDACSWCLVGALEKCYESKYHIPRNRVHQELQTWPTSWNDEPERTQEEVVALLKELDL